MLGGVTMTDDDIPLHLMYGANHFDMDEAFCARMRKAIEAGLEKAPIGVITLGTSNPKYVAAEPLPLGFSLGAMDF